jgi:hypothetical protein
MRKVTREAVNALLNLQEFRSGNTSVEVREDMAILRLHGNAIAIFTDDGRLSISNAGWETSTTKERLNGLPRVYINQKNYQWYLNGVQWDGDWTLVGVLYNGE